MKAMPLLLAISLVANLVLGWTLWQRRPVQAFDPAIVHSVAADTEDLPLPTNPMPLTVSPLLPLAGAAAYEPDHSAPPDVQGSLVSPPKGKPYGPPPPPNRHAFPAWQERLPHRETQFHRALLSEPR